ncbi:uncharacterized protein LOC112509405 [Cynara cardunculus var. scolymus]|uniref:Uncharacterized protein n=1 Tax=Cynara cardunculus var. scolymus TaxID=59895 RepID=A0A103YDZ7_CYNCS|nr:uncharacterized protein LOC112509405 [Cynara cardunculus var. scolymus]KVI07326.1 hypothetical protein Ccrd_014286 [Cynara cardunculus var. scolymus]
MIMAVNSTQQGCDSYSVVGLPDEVNTIPHCELPVALSDSLEDYVLLKSQISLDDQLINSQTYINVMVENPAAYSKCIEKVVDIEKGKSETPRINEETVDNLKNNEGQMKSLQKQISFEMGGKYMQLLMNHSLILPKFSTRDRTAAEKVVLEAPRLRKYKRTASFNSRKVVLLFSVLSSLGTIILIYLTLRVKQIGDASSTHSE